MACNGAENGTVLISTSSQPLNLQHPDHNSHPYQHYKTVTMDCRQLLTHV